MESTKQEVAAEILNQLGGYRFIAMTGAKNLISDNNSLHFKIMRNSKKITNVKIELNYTDTYDITFYRIWGSSVKSEYQVCGIYNDQLREVFTSHTGLDTNL